MKGPDSKSGRPVLPAQGFKSLHLRHMKTPLTSDPLGLDINGVSVIFLDFMQFLGVLTDALGLDT